MASSLINALTVTTPHAVTHPVRSLMVSRTAYWPCCRKSRIRVTGNHSGIPSDSRGGRGGIGPSIDEAKMGDGTSTNLGTRSYWLVHLPV